MYFKIFTLGMMFAVAPLMASASDYFVSPAGSGEMTGADAANAWDIEKLMEKFSSDNAATFENGDNIYFAGGKYVATKTLYVKKGLNLIGAAEGERTVFSGDANNDGVVNEGDRDRVFQINTASGVDATAECVSISNIDFDGLFIAQGGNDTKGALYLDNCGALVTVSKCNFTNLINTGQGANAFFSKRSSLKVIDCTFTGNKAANRGVVARLQSDNANKGWTTFERCLFTDNEATGAATDPCGIVMMQHGQQMNFVNCTFYNNKVAGRAASIFDATAPDATYKRILNVVSCTFANNTSGAETDADKVDLLLNASSTANILNSIVLGGATTGDNIAQLGNIVEKTYAEVFGTNVLTDGVLAPITKNETVEGFAAAVTALNPAINPEVDITVDQTGATRANNVVGAYDYAPTGTAIQTVTSSVRPYNSAAYLLTGQRANDNVKGLVIINGKKVVK